MNEWMIVWLNVWLIDCLIVWLIDWLIVWLNKLMGERVGGWMNEREFEQIVGICEWMNEWLIDWLIDCWIE